MEEEKQQEDVFNNQQEKEKDTLGNKTLLEERINSDSHKSIILGVIIFSIIVLVGVAVVFILNSDKESEEVVNDEPGIVEDPEDVIEFGILPLQNPTEMLNRFGALENYLNEYTDMNIKMKFYPTEGELGGFSAVVRDFIDDELGFVFLAPVTTIQAYGNIGDRMEVIACGERYTGSPTYQGDLLVRNDSDYQSIWDLEGKPVAGTSISSTSGGLMPEGMLKEEGIDSKTFFTDLEGEVGGITYLGSHDKAVEGLMSGLVEAAFVNEQTMYKFLEDGAEIRSIWRHDPVPEFPISANKNVVSEEQIEQLREVLLKSHEIDTLVHTRVDSNYNRFVSVSIDDYLPVQSAIDNVHGETFYDLDVWGVEKKEDKKDDENQETGDLEEESEE